MIYHYKSSDGVVSIMVEFIAGLGLGLGLQEPM